MKKNDLLKIQNQIHKDRVYPVKWASEYSFLTAHQHLLGYSVPANDVKVVIKERRYNQRYLAIIRENANIKYPVNLGETPFSHIKFMDKGVRDIKLPKDAWKR